jgi:hypothetical protein
VARTLTFDLNQIMAGQSGRRSPAYKVLVYDVRSTSDTIRDIVVGNPLDPMTGPEDITDFTAEVSIFEQAGSYAGDGIATSQVTIKILDPDFNRDPLAVVDDPDAPGRFFRSGNVLRIIEGDNQVPVVDWPLTFTGEFKGQAGYDSNRATGQSIVTAKALGRESTFLHYERTSEEFLIGTSYLEAAESVAVNEMGLDVDEINFPNFGAALIPHKVVQLVEEDPITMLARIMFVDAIIPHFQGDGKLSAIQDRATGAASRFYFSTDHILSLIRPNSDVEPPNSVCVIGLDSNLSRNNMPRQTLATMELTTGYFTPADAVKVFWRDDQTLMADNVQLKVAISVNGGLNVLGGGESITLIPSGDPDQIGDVGCYVEVDTGFAPWLIPFLLAGYVAASAIPDGTIPFGGPTIPIGSIVAAILLGGALLVMSMLGRGSYTFEGDPFEYVYAEIRRCARVSGTKEFDENELELSNHLITTIQQADAAAFQNLFRVQAEKQPRTLSMVHDVGLEPNDILEFGPNIPVTQTGLQDFSSRRYLVNTISRKLAPNPKRVVATVSCWDITSSVSGGT